VGSVEFSLVELSGILLVGVPPDVLSSGTTVTGTTVIGFGMHFGGVEVQSQILLSAPQPAGQTNL